MAKIYESPDGGRTIYQRDIGSLTRDLIKENRSLHDQILESQLWGEIRRAAETNPTIQEALDRAKIAYYLSKDNDNKIL
jgi:chemotaxis regulatin CheY-phosphate phosphatase CheZ